MAKLNQDDKFIVDRGGTTYKAELKDLNSSLEYIYTGVVDETPNGTIDSAVVDKKGQFFLENAEYELVSTSYNTIKIMVTEVDSDGGIVDFEISDNDTGLSPNEKFLTAPFSDASEIKTITNPSGGPTLPEGVSQVYPVYQDPRDVDDGFGGTITITPEGGLVEATGQPSGEDYLRIIRRGYGYVDSTGSNNTCLLREIGGSEDKAYAVEITASVEADTEYEESNPTTGIIEVISVSDGSDEDNALLTVQIGDDASTAQTVSLVPGRGIKFTSGGSNNEIIIDNTLDALGGGGAPDVDGTTALVIVNPSAPQEPTYNIKDGTLWYNTSNGRLYVAIRYELSGSYPFEWIDASPSSFNDALRKNQDDQTDNKIDVNNSLYASHFALERLPLINRVFP